MQKLASPIKTPLNTSDTQKTKKYAGFTLVELIVVITILVILGTIAFISLGGYSLSARDSTRISNLNNLHKGLSVFQIKAGTYPMPEGPITLTASGPIIGYQGFAKELTESIAKMSPGATKDPLDPTIYTTYSVNQNQTKIQLMNFLENGSTTTAYTNDIPNLSNIQNPLITQASASTTSDYSKRTPSTKGDTLGILLGNTGTTMNQPVQESYNVSSFTGVDIVASTGGIYKAIVSNTDIISGTGNVFVPLLTNYDSAIGTYPGCDTKDIKLPNGQSWAACNVGATTAYTNQPYPANTAFTAEQKAYLGGYYQWGRNKDVTSGSVTVGPLASDTVDNFIKNALGGIAPGANYDWLTDLARNDNLWGGSGTTATSGTFASQGSPSAMQGPCQTDYHVPTQKEWCDAIATLSPNIICATAWQSEANANLFRITMKLPLSGYRVNSDGSFSIQGSGGIYWASSPNGGINSHGVRMSTVQMNPLAVNNRSHGFTVRCLRN